MTRKVHSCPCVAVLLSQVVEVVVIGRVTVSHRLDHNTLLLLDVEHDVSVLLRLLDVLKVGLALVRNSDSGGHGGLLRAVFGLLSWVSPAAAIWRRTTCD